MVYHEEIKLGASSRKSAYRRVVRNDPCAYCGRRMIPMHPKIDNAALSDRQARRPTIDHIVPRSAGGKNIWTNLTGACYDCNCEKSSESLLHYLLSRLPE